MVPNRRIVAEGENKVSATPARAIRDTSSIDTRRPSITTSLTPVPSPPQRRSVSALVTTHNEAARIRECLESLTWCDEILVVDSYSTDDTVAIALSFPKVRVLQRPYYGGASQKNWAIDRLRHDWALILDADERVTPELRLELEHVLAEDQPASAYAIARRTFSLGQRIRFSGWQHDRVVRLFRRDAARYPNRRVHADMQTLEPPVNLEAPIDHHMVDDLVEYLGRQQRYSWWGAAQLWRDGRRAGAWEVMIRPLWRFIRTYIVQLGALEGVRGFVMCALQAYGAFGKYSLLWSWQRDAGRGRLPHLPDFDDDATTWTWPAETDRT